MSTSPTPEGNANLFLGLDSGTGGARASLIDASGTPQFRHAVHFTDNTWQEWRAALKQLLDAIPAEFRSRLKAIAICGTSATSLLCDAAGTPLLPAILYNDSRAQAENGFIPPSHIAASATSSLAKLLWFLDQPESAQARHFLHQADWLALQLHGIPGVSDYHNSLKLGYDVAELRYPAWLAQQPFAPLLPQVLDPGAAIGRVTPDIAERFGLPPDCMVRAGTTDSIAAFFASGANASGQAVTSLGSTLVLKLLSASRVEAPEYGIYSHRCGDLWLAGGASNCGGKVLEQIFGKQHLAELNTRLDPKTPSGLDYYPLPAPGERFPINDPDLPPRLEPRPADDALYLQGILESLARIEALGYKLLEKLGASTLREVFTAGGGAGNAAWTRMRAHALGVPVGAARHTEAAYGAALLAMHGEKLLYSTTP